MRVALLIGLALGVDQNYFYIFSVVLFTSFYTLQFNYYISYQSYHVLFEVNIHLHEDPNYVIP